MKWLRPWSIARATGIPLGVLALFFLFFSSVFLLSFRDFSQVLNVTVNGRLSSLTVTASLVRQCEWVRGMLFRLMLAENELVRADNMVELRRGLEQLDNELSRLSAIGLYSPQYIPLYHHVVELQQLADDLNTLMAQKNTLEQLRLILVKNLRTISDVMDSTFDAQTIAAPLRQAEAELVWSHHLHVALTLSMTLGTNIDASYGIRIMDVIRQKMRAARSSLPELPDGVHFSAEQAAHQLYERLLTCIQGEHGLFALFASLQDVQQRLMALSLRADYLANAVMVNAGTLATSATKDTENAGKELTAGFHSLRLLLLMFSVIAVVIVICVLGYLYLQVIRPIIQLEKVTSLRTQGVVTPMPNNGSVEVLEMASAVDYFAQELERRQQALQRSHETLEALVDKRTNELRVLSQRLLITQEAERARIAAELHDNVGATVSVIKFAIERALRMLRFPEVSSASNAECTEAIRAPLAEAVDLVKTVARQLRQFQLDLRPVYDDLGLRQALECFCEDYSLSHGQLRVETQFDFTDDAIPSCLRGVLFRLVQESFTNIAKHSKATVVTTSLLQTKDELILRVEDNGIGFDAEAIGGVQHCGLKNMRERVMLSGGTFAIHSHQGQGVVLCATWRGQIFAME